MGMTYTFNAVVTVVYHETNEMADYGDVLEHVAECHDELGHLVQVYPKTGDTIVPFVTTE